MSVVDAVAEAIRERILEGALPADTPLRETRLAAEQGTSRHSVRAALRALAGEGLVSVEANRGARVASLDPAAIAALYELRTALEVEAAHLALRRNGGRLPPPVHRAADAFAAACRAAQASWPAVSAAHGALHHAIVRAARSARIEEAHARTETETRLFLLQIRPFWTLEELAVDHLRLIADLEEDGPDVLRPHLRAAAAAVMDGERTS